MARGQPDFGAYQQTKTIVGVSDIGELAGRLGSIDTFDRGGQVVLLDDFEDNINKWDLSLTGAGSAIALSTDTAKNGAKSCKITTGDTIGDDSQMARYLGYPVSSKLGLEVSMAMHSFASPIDITLHTDNGTTWTVGRLRFKPDADTLQYLDSAGDYQDISTNVPVYLMKQAFHTFKLVIDLETGKYVRAKVNQTTFDLSDIALHTSTFLVHNFLGVIITTYARGADNYDTYVDDLIITQNEP